MALTNILITSVSVFRRGVPVMHFTERLNKLIEDLGADTKTLAAFSGFDRSQLSRLRTGKLIPRPWSSTVEKLTTGLYLFSDNRNDLGPLCAIIGASADAPWKSEKKSGTGCLPEQKKRPPRRDTAESLQDGREKARRE